MKCFALATILLFALTMPAWAGFEEGQAAYERGDYAAALREWRSLAERDKDVRAQLKLARMYRRGEGVTQDQAAAVEWYTKAAERGSNFYFDPNLQNSVQAAYTSAVGELNTIADNGDAWAQYA